MPHVYCAALMPNVTAAGPQCEEDLSSWKTSSNQLKYSMKQNKHFKAKSYKINGVFAAAVGWAGGTKGGLGRWGAGCVCWASEETLAQRTERLLLAETYWWMRSCPLGPPFPPVWTDG